MAGWLTDEGTTGLEIAQCPPLRTTERKLNCFAVITRGVSSSARCYSCSNYTTVELRELHQMYSV
jgi:hypothetical protein